MNPIRVMLPTILGVIAGGISLKVTHDHRFALGIFVLGFIGGCWVALRKAGGVQ